MKASSFLAAALLGASILLEAAPLPAKHATVELLSQEQSAAPGSETTLGLHFVLESGWHIYWVNPGDSGQPPALKWQLPEGFVAGDIQWPRPERMQSSPTLADYGYHGDVLLPVKIKISQSISAGQKPELVVDAKWLICREVCLPDHAQLRLSLPIAAPGEKNPSAAPLFAETEKLLPQPMPHVWKAKVTSRKDDFLLSLNVGKKITDVQFFPLDPGQIDNAAKQQVQPTVRGANIVLKKSDLLVKPVTTLRGVLVLAGEGYILQAPVQPQAALK